MCMSDIPYSRLFSTVKYFVCKILGCIKFSMRLDRSKITSYLKFVTPSVNFVRLKLMAGDRVCSARENGSQVVSRATMSIQIDGSPEMVKTLPAFVNLQY